MRAEAATAVLRLDAWLQTMRGRGGYSGPVSHWWESSLLYTGPMADWRYEGVMAGYVQLYRSTGDVLWLERAVTAGTDLVAALLPSGSYRNSAFQQGPMEGGTPHEAAVDVALLELATLLRERNDDSWRSFYRTAERNIEAYLIGRLWGGNGFVDQTWHRVLVANKNATTIEALILFEALSGRDMSAYLESAAAVIARDQERAGPRAGATVHAGTGAHRLAVGFYTARSMCGLLRMYERDRRDRWLEAVAAALPFLRGLYTSRGIHFGRYPDGRLIVDPRMVAAAGDVLRLMEWAGRLGVDTATDVDSLVAMLVAHQLPSSGLPTAFGFASKGSRRPYHGLPDFRDLLPVVGWCDKAFRGLAMVAGPELSGAAAPATEEVELPCVWKGRAHRFVESGTHIALVPDKRGAGPVYRWDKGSCQPAVHRL